MRRLIVIVVAALAGSTAGYVAKQLNERRSNPDSDTPLVIGAPAVNAVIAAVIGLVSGRRGRPVAFTVGFAISAVAGLSMQHALKEKLGFVEESWEPDDDDQASATSSSIDSSK